MKCPNCGQEMVLDSHRKIDLLMCYNCGYIEGRNLDPRDAAPLTNYQHLLSLNLEQSAAFLAGALELPEEQVAAWLKSVSE